MYLDELDEIYNAPIFVNGNVGELVLYADRIAVYGIKPGLHNIFSRNLSTFLEL